MRLSGRPAGPCEGSREDGAGIPPGLLFAEETPRLVQVLASQASVLRGRSSVDTAAGERGAQ